jgi:hypothetical protein
LIPKLQEKVKVNVVNLVYMIYICNIFYLFVRISFVSVQDLDPGHSTIKTPAVLSPLIRSVFRLWCHENTRTYYDRLLDEDQRFWFAALLNEQVEECFCDGEHVFGVELPDPEEIQAGLKPITDKYI